MNNRQSAASKLSIEQIQVLLTGKFGDGSLNTVSKKRQIENHEYNYYYSTNCIHREYVEFKKTLLGNLCNKDIYKIKNTGFKISDIYVLNTKTSSEITQIACESLEDSLKRLNQLGLALWFFDDGSLHKTKEFYNLNTQSFSKEIQYDLFVPYFKQFDITAIPTIERKKDGREFWYLRIGKFNGAFIISEILSQYNLECFQYKLISSETIQKWSKLQEELKSMNIDTITNQKLSRMLKQVSI